MTEPIAKSDGREFGVILARFQPYHNEHWHYTELVLSKHNTVIIGITNSDPGAINTETLSSHRHLEASNPFTYFERMAMIKDALIEQNVDLRRVLFTPFHISDTSKLKYYLPEPSKLIIYNRIFGDWEQEKHDRLSAAGYNVAVLEPGVKKGMEATTIRDLAEKGDPEWKSMVPVAIADHIEKIRPSGLWSKL